MYIERQGVRIFINHDIDTQASTHLKGGALNGWPVRCRRFNDVHMCVYKKLSNLPGLKAMVQNKKKVLEMYAATKKKRSVFNLGNVDGSLGGKNWKMLLRCM